MKANKLMQALKMISEAKQEMLNIKAPLSPQLMNNMCNMAIQGHHFMQIMDINYNQITPGNILWLEENGYTVEVEEPSQEGAYTTYKIYWCDPEDNPFANSGVDLYDEEYEEEYEDEDSSFDWE